MNVEDRIQNITMMLCDVDGVLTDGGIIYDNEGIETKRFHIRDGLGIKLWQRVGHRFGLITARTSHVVQIRASELGIDLVRQGFAEKLSVVRKLLQDLGQTPETTCYIGDDLTDLPVMKFVGLAASVADAAPDVRQAAHLVTDLQGGEGAVRELIERLLQAQGRWSELVQKYLEI
ncbi:MAG: HAD hydrolase family protein [Planctomycetales bacterium]|nr:HAD hydrolase family protein [Planctomycetales bacterium]